jgi:hypothetical protein
MLGVDCPRRAGGTMLLFFDEAAFVPNFASAMACKSAVVKVWASASALQTASVTKRIKQPNNIPLFFVARVREALIFQDIHPCVREVQNFFFNKKKL